MQRWHGLDAVPDGWGPCVVTVGVFDGVHRGHQVMLGDVVRTAESAGLPSVLVTFVPHPSEVVRPGSHPPVLTTIVRRAELVAGLGIDAFCALPFSAEFAQSEPARFVEQVLVEGLHASTVVVGENFRFGRGASGDVALLTEMGPRAGFTAHGVDLVRDDGIALSATFVRRCVAAGDVATAAWALGRPHRVDGVVERGDQRGRDLGYPTANLRADDWAAIPADGVYAGRVVRLDEWGRTVEAPAVGTAAISIGTNPTFEVRQRRVEAFVLDFAGDLYGAGIGIEFAQRLRGMERFDSVDALVEQMAADVVQTRSLMTGQT